MKHPTTGKVPPSNLPAEESLLGAMLVSANVVEEVWREMSPDDFYRPTHGHIFAAMIALRSQGRPVDTVTVADELRRVGLLDGVGGLPTLLGLVNSTPSLDAARYAMIVRNTAALRRLIMVAADVSALGYGGDDAQTVAEKAVAMFGAVDTPREAAPLDLMTVEEFMALGAEYQRRWVIPDTMDDSRTAESGSLREAHRAMIVAPEGQGKGVFLRQIALSVSQGRHPFSPKVAIPPKRTLYVDLENPPGAVMEQIGLSRPYMMHLNRDRFDGGWLAGSAHILARESGLDLRSRTGRAQVESSMEKVEPSLLVIGPVYKAFRKKGGEDYAAAAEDAIAFIDELRIRYSCAVLLEAHAAKASGGHRDMDPAGSQQWMAFPEIGRAMIPVGEPPNAPWSMVELRPFRGDRERVNWPTHLHKRTHEHSPYLPWIGYWANGRDPAELPAQEF